MPVIHRFRKGKRVLIQKSLLVRFCCLGDAYFTPASGYDFETHAGVKTGLETSYSPLIPAGSPPDDGRPYKLEFSEQYGPGFTFGPFIEAKYPSTKAEYGYGLELGLRYSLDAAWGTTNTKTRILKGEVETGQTQTAYTLHLPVVFEVSPPDEWFELGDDIQTSAGMGVEVVHQFSSSLSYTRESTRPDNNVTDTDSATYALLTLNLGAEFDVGPVTMPVELRWGYSVFWNRDFDGCTDLSIPGPYVDDKLVYNGAYQMHLGLFTGITHRF